MVQLSEELIIQILMRLPVKYLLRFKCVYIKPKHGSGGLCDGIDPSQQTLLRRSENVNYGCVVWSLIVTDGKVNFKDFVCACDSFINIFTAYREYHIMLTLGNMEFISNFIVISFSHVILYVTLYEME